MTTCSAPLSWSELVLYWARDVEQQRDDDDAALDKMDEHLMGCPTCTADSEVVAKLAIAVREFVPPCITRAHLERLRERGAQINENVFLPGERKLALFHRGVDFLIHRLSGLDLANTEHVDLTVRIESTGDVLHTEKNVPFDTHEGVLIACQRHFAHMPPDTMFEIRATDTSGQVREATYIIPHEFEEGVGP